MDSVKKNPYMINHSLPHSSYKEFVKLNQAVDDYTLFQDVNEILFEAIENKIIIYHYWSGSWHNARTRPLIELVDGSNLTDEKGERNIIITTHYEPIAGDYPEEMRKKVKFPFHERKKEIRRTWNKNILYVKRSDLEEMTKQQNRESPEDKDSPQARKKENNLLKVIGGFVQTTYLKNKPGKYWNGDKPNISEIAKSFQVDLSRSGYSDEGFKERTLRDIISSSLEQIKENKTPER